MFQASGANAGIGIDDGSRGRVSVTGDQSGRESEQTDILRRVQAYKRRIVKEGEFVICMVRRRAVAA
jgi:hypothetical protein